MKSFQVIAILLWGIIFIVAAFILGQFLASNDIFDISEIITGKKDSDDNIEPEKDDILASDIVINKVGQETIRVGYNVAKEYFENYYEAYINYIMENTEIYPENQKMEITDTLATDYVFYAVSNKIDVEKYPIVSDNGSINIREAEINSFIDKMFAKDIDQTYKKDGKYGYNNVSKIYSIDKEYNYRKYIQSLENIENVTSNELILTYNCKEMSSYNKSNKENKIQLKVTYKGGRYIVTEVQK